MSSDLVCMGWLVRNALSHGVEDGVKTVGIALA